MPSMSDDDDHPFDVRRTPCRGMGIVAETFRQTQGVLRSDSPHAFAAIGPRAQEITAPHPWDVPHGPDSPVGRVHDLEGQVVLLGVGHDANTMIHLAESLAGVRYRRRKDLTLLMDGVAVRKEYWEIDHCCERFALMDQWLDEARLQRRGRVGQGEARLARARDIVRVASLYIKESETVFLHEPGVDVQCDEARASIAPQ
jgi:aminoglycoside N3'-acetyltransferase